MAEYTGALYNLINKENTLFKVYEPEVSKNKDIYHVNINTDTFFSGDVIHFFTISSLSIEEANLEIDGQNIYSTKYRNETNVTFEYHSSINVVACDRSNIRLVIKAELPPIVYTYYSLLLDRKKYYRKKITGNPGYINGYFGKVYNGAEFSR